MKKLLLVPLLLINSFCFSQEIGNAKVKKTISQKKKKESFMWFDLKPGKYINMNCNSKKIYEWDRTAVGIGMAQMSLAEVTNNTSIDVLSTEKDNYEIINGGLIYDNSKKIIILSKESFLTDDGCIWTKKR